MRFFSALLALTMLLIGSNQALAQKTVAEQEVMLELGTLDAHGRSPQAHFKPLMLHPSFVHGFSTIPLAADPTVAARQFLSDHAGLLAVMDPDTELIPLTAIPWQGRTIVRMGQVFQGLPVFDGVAVVRVEADGSVSALSSNLGTVPADLSTTPALTAQAAADEARAILPWSATVRSSAPGVYVTHDGAHLVWRVSLLGPVPSLAAVMMVDAVDGRILYMGDPIKKAQGLIYTQNPVRDDGATTEVELLRLTGDATVLTGEYAEAWRYDVDGVHTQTAVADTDGNFLYTPARMEDEPVFDDPFAEVNAYYQIDWLSNYYRTVHGHTPPHSPMKVYVNYVEEADTAYENAFFDPEAWSISLGQAPTGDFAYDFDTIAHEFTHSINRAMAEFAYFGADQMGMLVFPGGLDEGLADTFAVSLTNDPDLGEYIFGRNLVNDRVCPDDIMGEVHYDGEIVGGAHWDIHEIVGGDALEHLAFGALSTSTTTSSYADFAAGLMAAAEAMETDGDLTSTQLDEIQTVLDDRGMTVCNRFIALDDGLSYSLSGMGLGMMGDCDMMLGMASMAGYRFPPLVQWSIDVPDDATSLTFDAAPVIMGARGDEVVSIAVRAGDPVIYEMVDVGGFMTLPLLVQDADHVFEEIEGQAVIDLDSDPALQPGETYYFAIGYLGCPAATFNVSAEPGFEVAEPEPEEAPEPDEIPEPVDDATTDAGLDSTDPHGTVSEGGGCGCTIAH